MLTSLSKESLRSFIFERTFEAERLVAVFNRSQKPATVEIESLGGNAGLWREVSGQKVKDAISVPAMDWRVVRSE